LALQTAGTTAISINASQAVSLTSSLAVTGTITAGSTDGTITTGNGILNLVSTGGNDVVINCGSTRQTIFKAGGTEKARINSSAAFVLAGGDTASNGAGIAFPAAQSASSDANTLDDYEEGTWTPTIQNFTVSGTSTLTGTYTKIGRVVYFNVTFDNTGTIAFGTSALITLPFTGVFQSGMIAMCLQSNGESQTSGKSGVQMSIDAVNSRFFVGNFTTTSAGETLQFGGFYRVS